MFKKTSSNGVERVDKTTSAPIKCWQKQYDIKWLTLKLYSGQMWAN